MKDSLQESGSTSHATSIDISTEVRKEMISLLNQQLADTFDLMSQTKQAHWNVKGSSFIALHKLFDELAALLLEPIDEIAERATSLGGNALGTARMAAAATRLPECPVVLNDGNSTLKMLAERYSLVAKSTREAISKADEADDQGTADMFTALSRELDKALYFIEAHLQS